MPRIRDLTAEEAETLRERHHERRAADDFACPYCGADSGISANTSDPAIIQCHACGQEFFSWTVQGTIHVTAKL